MEPKANERDTWENGLNIPGAAATEGPGAEDDHEADAAKEPEVRLGAVTQIPVGEPSGRAKIGKKAVAAIVAAAVVAALSGGFVLAKRASGGDSSGKAVSAQVSEGDISQVISGSGSLSADKTVNVLVPAGLEVEQVLVNQGDKVEVGTPIAKVSAASVQEKLLSIEENIDTLQDQRDNLGSGVGHYELKKQVLDGQISDLKADRDKIAKLLDTLTLTSDTSGTVGSVNLFKNTDTGQSSLREQQKGQSSSSASGSSSTQNGAAQGLSGNQDSSGGAGDTSQASYSANGAGASTAPMTTSARPVATTAAFRPNAQGFAAGYPNATLSKAGQAEGEAGGVLAADDGASSQDSGQGTGSDNPAEPIRIKGTLSLDVTAPATGAAPQTEVKVADNASFTAKISWVPAAETFAGQRSYAAVVTLTAEDGYCFANPDHLDVRLPGCADMDREFLDLDGDGFAETLKLTAYYPATEAAGKSDEAETGNGCSGAGVAAESDADGSYDAGGNSYDLESSSNDSSSRLTQSGSSYSDTEAIAITVTPDDKMYLDVNVDELDILKVSTDQEATVKVDAIGGEAFTGKIVSIDDGSAKAIEDDSGNSSVKYDVRIELPRDDRMRYGMSAKASITVDERKGVLLVPVDAVSNVDGKSVVYTSVDDKGTLSSPTEVTTGLSDANQVEVTKGLSAGATVYYTPTTQGDDEEEEQIEG